MDCKNCGELVEGNFCSHCGQKSNVGQITFSNFLNELSVSVFQINRGFFFTLIELQRRPGKSIKEYLRGRRKKYFKPIAYLLTLSTIYYIITQITGQNTWMDDLIAGFSLGPNDAKEEIEIPPILIWFSNNFAYSTLLLLPVFSFASYLSFSGLGTSYMEHLVLNSYTTGQQAIFYSLFAVIKTCTESEFIELLPVVFAFLYILWVFRQFFYKGNRTINIFRSILTYILYVIFSCGILLIVMGISEILS